MWDICPEWICIRVFAITVHDSHIFRQVLKKVLQARVCIGIAFFLFEPLPELFSNIRVQLL
ncbi:hypothetical protein AXF13_08085 [Desulfovibrio fairfieldensis]|uniref:Uncharacterized protein n=1 Tax=Desulfovibrio fairfieldensis TaxID=44742 RepID=A0A0X8JJT7_9BACT|nr:hypothetical protein AXF13_08085 [Desulfovibrio fairfieldensis]